MCPPTYSATASAAATCFCCYCCDCCCCCCFCCCCCCCFWSVNQCPPCVVLVTPFRRPRPTHAPRATTAQYELLIDESLTDCLPACLRVCCRWLHRPRTYVVDVPYDLPAAPSMLDIYRTNPPKFKKNPSGCPLWGACGDIAVSAAVVVVMVAAAAVVVAVVVVGGGGVHRRRRCGRRCRCRRRRHRFGLRRRFGRRRLGRPYHFGRPRVLTSGRGSGSHGWVGGVGVSCHLSAPKGPSIQVRRCVCLGRPPLPPPLSPPICLPPPRPAHPAVQAHSVWCAVIF